MTTAPETLSAQLEQLRALYQLLASVPDSRQHDDLIDRARVAIAAVRRTRATMIRAAAPGSHAAAGGATGRKSAARRGQKPAK